MTPADNFNYAMSYSFLNHYFVRSAGIRGSYSVFNDKIKLVAGLYNSYNPAGASNPVVADTRYGLSDFCTQLFITPIKHLNLSGALWIEGKKDNGKHRNFQAKYDVNKRLKLGLDVTRYTCVDSVTANHTFTGIAGYVQHSFGKFFTVGGRYEYMEKIQPTYGTITTYDKGYYNIYTLTTSFKVGHIVFKQEFKLDQTNKKNANTFYLDKDSKPTDEARQIVFAAIYTF
jgi:hypothetical protein